MLDEHAKKLAAFVKSLPDFIHYETYDGNYNHIGATVADAVLQRGHNYEAQVRPRIDRIRRDYSDATSTSAALQVLEIIGPSNYLDWGDDNNRDCKLFYAILVLLKRCNVETEEDLRKWLSDNKNLMILKSLGGIGPKTADYFGILVGLNKTAIDMHLRNFLARTGVKNLNYDDTQKIIEKCAQILNKKVVKFDHSIWQYERKKSAEK